MSTWFEKLQSIGMSLMLPIAVLPAAALLMRLGAPDVLDIPFITKAGGSIFDNLALIFSIGIATGLAKDSNGTAVGAFLILLVKPIQALWFIVFIICVAMPMPSPNSTSLSMEVKSLYIMN